MDSDKLRGALGASIEVQAGLITLALALLRRRAAMDCRCVVMRTRDIADMDRAEGAEVAAHESVLLATGALVRAVERASQELQNGA